MATYKEIQDYVNIYYGYVPKTCWIAHCKEIYGLQPKVSANRHSTDKRKHPCPTQKQSDILEAFKFYKMVD